MEKGELWLTNLPQQVGKEQVGRRPALIIANTQTGLLIVLPLSANLETSIYPHTLKINASDRNGQ